jgi:hypothetical protein
LSDDAPLLNEVFPDLIRALDARLTHLVDLSSTAFTVRAAIGRLRAGLGQLRLLERDWTGVGESALLLCGARDWTDPTPPARLNLGDITLHIVGERILAIDLTRNEPLLRALDFLLPSRPPPNLVISHDQPRLVDELPNLASAVRQALLEPPAWVTDRERIQSLRSQLDELRVFARCCAQDTLTWCGPVYTVPKPHLAEWRGRLRTTPLRGWQLLVHAVDNRVVKIDSLEDRRVFAEVARLFEARRGFSAQESR